MPTKVKNEIENTLCRYYLDAQPEKWEETNKFQFIFNLMLKLIEGWRIRKLVWEQDWTCLWNIQSENSINDFTNGLANASIQLVHPALWWKNSLRDQTQERVNEAFGLDHWGGSNDKIISLTNINDDYNESVKADNGTDAFRRALEKP